MSTVDRRDHRSERRFDPRGFTEGWERGKGEPNATQLLRIAKSTRRSLRFFFRPIAA